MGISKFFGLELIVAALIAVSAVPKTNLFFDITETQMFVVLGIIFISHWIEVYVENRTPSPEKTEEQGIEGLYS